MTDPFPRLSRSEQPAFSAGVVHLGLGAFFRAFGVPVLGDLMQQKGGDWGIIGVSLRSPATRDALAPQGFVYTAVEQSPEDEIPRVQQGILNVLVAPEDPSAVLDKMADPNIRIVSLTVTEKGYCHDPATGRLNLDHPDIRHDIGHDLPRSAIGFLVRGLETRRNLGRPPFTILSCDNLPENGHLTKSVVLALARRIDPDLALWIDRNGRFPNTMVDRIVPAAKPEDLDRIAAMTGRRDAAPVLHEPFRQWVIEDDFVPGLGAARRPEFELAGVEMVPDVHPYENMKLRMLNGTHSALAYLGYLAGHETVYEASADPVFEAYLKRLWSKELAPSFEAPDGVDLGGYAQRLLKRYQNPAIQHRTWQIAMDGSQKLPQRILAPIRDNLAASRPSPGLILVVAAWIRYVSGSDDAGNPIDVRDALLAQLQTAVSTSTGGADRVKALLAVREVFDPELAASIQDQVTEAYLDISQVGARRSIEKFLEDREF